MRSIFLFAATVLLLSACISDDDRCGEGEHYVDGSCTCDTDRVYENGQCVLVETETLTEPLDTESVTETGPFEGLGSECTFQGTECEAYPGDLFCAADPSTNQGKCTVVCDGAPDSCPSDWQCCDFPAYVDALFDNHDLCLDDEMYQVVISAVGSCDG